MIQNEDKLQNIRHSLAHLLAIAALEYDEHAKLTIGPATEGGFYYDIDFEKEAPTGKDLKKIEKRMRNLIRKDIPFERQAVTAKEAREQFGDNPYKLEIIEAIVASGEQITFYKTGSFIDLCRGGHVERTSEIDLEAFKIREPSGAYWRGDEKNQMLTRISGIAFENKEGLEKYEKMVEEAKLRDHRKLGKELDLFTFSDLVGPGLPLWTPKGTILRDTLDTYVWKLRKEKGYQKVVIPHITKKDLYEKSGHWQKFGDELFKVSTREGHEFAMKPMNCPHHTQIYNSRPRSYRDLPQRYSETTTCYRDEQTGELHGLSRVRALTQDDAHVFCRKSQVKEEFLKVWDIIDTFYKTVGYGALEARLSLHDPEDMDGYLGDEKDWMNAEADLRALASERGVEAAEAIGEAAFYGPKVDFMTRDALGREWQVATIQLDINLPERFDLTCTNEEGEKERIVMIHAAIMGSLERFLSNYIEHTGGKFPFWLAPVQVAILPVSKEYDDYALKVCGELKGKDVRAELYEASESLGKRIRTGKGQKIPYLLVVGEKEKEASTVSVESRDDGQLGTKSIEDFLKLEDHEEIL